MFKTKICCILACQRICFISMSVIPICNWQNTRSSSFLLKPVFPPFVNIIVILPILCKLNWKLYTRCKLTKSVIPKINDVPNSGILFSTPYFYHFSSLNMSNQKNISPISKLKTSSISFIDLKTEESHSNVPFSNRLLDFF